MRSLSLLEPWHLLLRLVASEDSTAWTLPPLDKGVRFVVASWCAGHRRWYDPAGCARCLSTETHVGVRVSPKDVRRVRPLDPSEVCGALSQVARQLDEWLRRAWGAFSPPSVLRSDRQAARLLRGLDGAPDPVEVVRVEGKDERRVETWSFQDAAEGASWDALVVRARLLNRVLGRLGRGLPDGVRLYATRRAWEVVERLGSSASRVFPFVMACMEAVVDCVLVVQMRTVGTDLVARRTNTAGAGFLWFGQSLMLPQPDGAVRLLRPEEVAGWMTSTFLGPTGRAPSAPNLQEMRQRSLSERLPIWGFQARNLVDETIMLSKLDQKALARMRDGLPPDSADDKDGVSDLVDAIRYTIEHHRKQPKDGPVFRVGSVGDLRRPLRGMGKRA